MWSFFVRIWDGLRALFALIVPFAGGARRIGSPVVRWGLRLLLLALIWVGLYLLNRTFEVGRFVPVRIRYLPEQYLPILGFLVLGWLWLGWYLWKLLTEDVGSDFPDIDAAWKEARAALAEEGLDPGKVPIFLVLGRPIGGETALLEAAVAPSGRSLRVRGAPRGGPLRVYASDDAIYVTCAGASVLGRNANLVAHLGTAPAPVAVPAAGAPSHAGADNNIFKTMHVRGNARRVRELLAEAAEQKGEPTAQQQRQVRDLLGGGAMSFAVEAPGAGPSLVRDEADLEEDGARLEHLCRLIARERQPELPVKGILLLLPWGAATTDEAAAATAEACRRDLATARSALRVNCPLIALVTDLEVAPGFREFAAHFKEDRLKTGRIGRKFPLLPEANGRTPAEIIASGLAWFCTAEFPTWIYEFFALEKVESDRPDLTTDGNVRLYQILAQLLERHERFGRILATAVTAEAAEPAMFGGCYLAGTGGKVGRDQAFIAAVFHRLLEEHKQASWDRRAVADDARQRQRGTWGLAAAGAGFVLLLAAIGCAIHYK